MAGMAEKRVRTCWYTTSAEGTAEMCLTLPCCAKACMTGIVLSRYVRKRLRMLSGLSSVRPLVSPLLSSRCSIVASGQSKNSTNSTEQ